MPLVAVSCSKSASEGETKQIQELQRRVSYLELAAKIQPGPKWVRIDPTDKGYQKIGTALLPLFVETKDATQYLNGYKIKIALGNPYFVKFSGFTLTARWDKQNGPWDNFGKPDFRPPPLSSKDNTNSVPATFIADSTEAKKTVEQHTEELSPGSWTTIEFAVVPATVDDLKNLRIAVDLNELSLPATQTE